MNVNAPSQPGRLSRRSILAALAATPALATILAACGSDDDAAGSSSTSPDTTTPGSVTATTDAPDTTSVSVPSGGIEHPTGADEVVLRFGYVGGFVPMGFAFTNVPTMLIAGDGKVYQQGAQIDIYPGPLLPALTVRSITEDGIQRVLELADTAHLLQAPPDYSAEINVADAADTQVIINAGGETYLHQAPALGFDIPEKTDARQALAKFTELLGDLANVAGAENLGEEAPLVAESYRVLARVVTQEELDTLEMDPKLVPWPVEVGSLADAAECAVVTADAIGSLLIDADQLTYFTEGEVVYQVFAVAFLPGDTC